jgi:nucleotide-binding universal stress UspA family protein
MLALNRRQSAARSCSDGRRGAAALILGSETGKVLTHSTIPVPMFR